MSEITLNLEINGIEEMEEKLFELSETIKKAKTLASELANQKISVSNQSVKLDRN
ncbi:MAG: hypothetical protein FWG64_13000 [Firmicutes bacterium]|nr:hypothetical protein [Bacillota bacterium]